MKRIALASVLLITGCTGSMPSVFEGAEQEGRFWQACTNFTEAAQLIDARHDSGRLSDESLRELMPYLSGGEAVCQTEGATSYGTALDRLEEVMLELAPYAVKDESK